MKKSLLIVLSISIMLLMPACGKQMVSSDEQTIEPTTAVESDSTNETIEAASEIETIDNELSLTEISGDRIPMVMVDGLLYYDTGKESMLEGRCGMMDGEITSSVDASEIPTEDNQSNFGTGFGYQYGINNSIDIQMEDGTWFVFQREGTEYVEPTENTDNTDTADNTITEPLFIRMENPSWEYYTAESVVSGTKPYGIKLFEESANEIIDTDAWFERNELQLAGNSNEEEYGCYIDYDGVIVCITKGGEVITELEFTEFMYAPDLVEEDRDFVDEKVRDAKIRNGVLYVSISHLTYAESAPSNAYIMAISLEDYSIIWKSEPLVCNSYNFEIVDDIIFTGYGFTAEPDYLFQIDRLTGTVLETYKLKSKADYIICKDDKLYVRTYNTDYVFEVTK